MDQYYPCYKAFQYRELSRRITAEEYKQAVNFAKKAGLTRLCHEPEKLINGRK